MKQIFWYKLILIKQKSNAYTNTIFSKNTHLFSNSNNSNTMKKSFFSPLWQLLPQSIRCSRMRVWWKEIFLSILFPYQLRLAATAEDTCNKVLHVFPNGLFRSRPSPAEFHSLPHRWSWSGTYSFEAVELIRELFQVKPVRTWYQLYG